MGYFKIWRYTSRFWKKMIKINFKKSEEKITLVCDNEFLYIYTNKGLYKIASNRIFYHNLKDLTLYDQEGYKIHIVGSWSNDYYYNSYHTIFYINDVILYRLKKLLETKNIKINHENI